MSFSRMAVAGVFGTVALAATGMSAPALAQQASMTFFVTSAGSGKGGDLGGLPWAGLAEGRDDRVPDGHDGE